MPKICIPTALAAATICVFALSNSTLAATADTGACVATQAAVLAVYRATPPLLATERANTLRVTLHADGCVVTQLPRHYVNPGTYAERLADDDFATVRQHLASVELLRFDAASMHQTLRRARTTDDVRTRVYDEDIVDLELHPALAASQLMATKHIRWSSLQQDLLAAPDDRRLVALAAAQGMLAELAERHLAPEATP